MEQEALNRKASDRALLNATLGVAAILTFGAALYGFYQKNNEKSRRKDKLRRQKKYNLAGTKEKDFFYVGNEGEGWYQRLHWECELL